MLWKALLVEIENVNFKNPSVRLFTKARKKNYFIRIYKMNNLPMKVFKLGDIKYGLVLTENKYIIVESDFYHYIYNNTDECQLPHSVAEDPISCALGYLELIGKPLYDLPTWAHYWGIKTRVRTNYNLFLKTLEHYNIDISSFPKWPK